MARPLRLEYEGAIYHLISRGDRKESIFLDDEDRKIFLKTLEEANEKAGWNIHAFILMSNHFHLVIETPQPTLVSGMKWFLGTYTQRFNARHQMRGHLFSGRYKSLLVDERDGSYFRTVCDYVHFNPMRAGIVDREKGLESYPWSSYAEYLKHPTVRWKALRVERLFREHGIQSDDEAGRTEFWRRMSERFHGQGSTEEQNQWEKIKRGWKFGADDFAQRLGKIIDQQKVEVKQSQGKERSEGMEEKAQRIIREFLMRECEGMELEIFRKLRKGDALKIRLTQELRKQTTMTMAWIAKELNAGVPQTLWKALWVAQQNRPFRE